MFPFRSQLAQNIAQAAGAAQERNLPLGELAEKMQAAKAKGQNPADLLNQWTVGEGSDDEKRAMAAMAALDGAPWPDAFFHSEA